MRRIILASASPRRSEILRQAGLSFTVDPGDYEEVLDPLVPPRRLARLLSLQKARAVAGRYKEGLVIAADTFIVFKGRLLGKPHTPAEARRMLKELNGRTHFVITGFTVLDAATGKRVSRSAQTSVSFRKLTLNEIDAYVASGEPLDKAGAYAIQGLGAVLVKEIRGDYLNVVGLPLSTLVQCLKEFGVRVLAQKLDRMRVK